MKPISVILVFILFFSSTNCQQRFIKITGGTFGAALRISPAADLGWTVFSLDSLKLARFNSCGEIEWSKKYNIPNTYNVLKDFIRTRNGDFILVTFQSSGSQYTLSITRLDTLGFILWSKSYEDTFYDLYPYSIGEDSQGNLFLYGNMGHVNTTGYNMISKMDGSGNIFWTRFYDHGGTWGGAIVTSDNGVLLRTGNMFIKTDAAGNEQWTSFFTAGSNTYYEAVEVNDGYIFPGTGNSSSLISFYKMDKQGNLLWSSKKTLDVGGYPPRFHKKSNGNIVAVFKKFFAGSSYLTIVEFDKNLTIVSQSSIDAGISLSGADICFLNDGTPVLAAVASNSNLAVAKMNVDYHTNCDINLPLISITPEPITHLSFITNVTSYNLTVINKNYIADSLSISVTTLCNIPKLLNLGNDTILCKGVTMILKNQSSDFFDHYLWSTGETTASIIINQPGTYWLYVNDDCRENRLNDTVWIQIFPAIEPDLGPDLLLCENSTHVFKAPDCDSCTIAWNTGSTIDSMVVNDQGTYWLSVKNNNGCISSDTVEVSNVKCECDFYLPNAFTPNNDGLNETFHPVYYCDVNDYNLQIFNRWGELIYSTDNIEREWNGRFNSKAVAQGIYLYVVKYKPVIKGKLNDRITKAGAVAVIY